MSSATGIVEPQARVVSLNDRVVDVAGVDVPWFTSTLVVNVTGIDTLKAIKQILKSDKDAIIVIVSAMGQQDMVVESIQAGAKDFIVKPFQRSRITEAIARLLRD